MSEQKKVLVIKSSEWLRATGRYDDEEIDFTSGLYVPSENRMCCLGIHMNQCGISKEELSGGLNNAKPSLPRYATPRAVPPELASKAAKNGYPWVDVENRKVATTIGVEELPTVYERFKVQQEKAMLINDDFSTTDKQKIELLRPLFRKAGWEIDWRPDE